MGKVMAVCISEKRGTLKKNIITGEFIENYGIKNDAHAGNWHRQISLLSFEKEEEFKSKGGDVTAGSFGENLLVSGIDFKKLPVGTVLKCGDVVLKITQIGKECHSHCEIFKQVGDCIMPREGVFAKVIKGGTITAGDDLYISDIGFTVGIITASDKGSKGEREDISGRVIKEIAEKNGYEVKSYKVLPDEEELLTEEICRLCDKDTVDLILTTGGTGFSPRDCTPEATIKAAERLVPGIPEAIRAYSMTITKRAMLSRAAAGIRKKTLIINLPGSPKAVKESLEYIISELPHGLNILKSRESECAR